MKKKKQKKKQKKTENPKNISILMLRTNFHFIIYLINKVNLY